MAQLRDIKSRIESVQKTRKMTQAMKMVSAAKFKRFSRRMSDTEPSINALSEMLSIICQQESGNADFPLLSPNGATKTLYVALTGDRGLCGSFNANILKFSDKQFTEEKEAYDVIVFGRKGAQYFKSRQYPVIKEYERFYDDVSAATLAPIIDELVDLFMSGTYGKVVLMYNEFISAIANKPKCHQLLPLAPEGVGEENTNYFLEPSPQDVVNSVAQDYIKLKLLRSCLESSAAEQGARMAAMDSATNNAGDMIKDLTLLYNRQRQAQITTELSEIVAGAEALVS